MGERERKNFFFFFFFFFFHELKINGGKENFNQLPMIRLTLVKNASKKKETALTKKKKKKACPHYKL